MEFTTLKKRISAAACLNHINTLIVAFSNGNLSRFSINSSDPLTPEYTRHLLPVPWQMSVAGPPTSNPAPLPPYGESSKLLLFCLLPNGVRVLTLDDFEDVVFVETSSPPTSVAFAGEKTITIGTQAGRLVTVFDIFAKEVATIEVDVHAAPILALIPESSARTWIMTPTQCLAAELKPSASEISLTLRQTIPAPEPIAAVARTTHSTVARGRTYPVMLCASEQFVTLLTPDWKEGGEVRVMATLPAEEPLNAVLPAAESAANQGRDVIGYTVTTTGTILEIVATAASTPPPSSAPDSSGPTNDGSKPHTHILSIGEDFAIEVDADDEASVPFGFATMAVKVSGKEGAGSQLENHIIVTAGCNISIAPLSMSAQSPRKEEPGASTDNQAEQSTEEKPSNQEEETVVMKNDEFSVLLSKKLQQALSPESSPKRRRPSSQPDGQTAESDAATKEEEQDRPPTRQSLTMGLDTSDLDAYSNAMDVPTKARLVGDGVSGESGDLVRFVPIGLNASVTTIRNKLEEIFDRRLVISFQSTSGVGKKFLELRPSTVRIFHAQPAEDRILLCRPLYPQLSRSRSQTPMSHMSQESLLSSARDTSMLRPVSQLSRQSEQGMVQRLYADSERSKAIKLLQLEEKFIPRAAPQRIPVTRQKDLLERLTTGFVKKKEQSTKKIRDKMEKDGYILKKPPRPDLETEQQIIQKFHYEAMKKEKLREEKLEKKLFKPPKAIKLKTDEEWKAWQEKRSKDIKKEYRMKDPEVLSLLT